MPIKKEVIWTDSITPAAYLQELYLAYPYDIEEALVYSLLESEPVLSSALWNFIDYARHVHKYQILAKPKKQCDLTPLYITMCQYAQRNHTVLHTHQFQFDAILHVRKYTMHNPYAYLPLEQVYFVDQIQLLIPPSINLCSPQSAFMIENAEEFPYHGLSFNATDFLALSIRIADQNGILYLPKKQIGLLCACASLYQIDEPAPHADFILLYGIANKYTKLCTYYDATNQLYVGLAMGEENINSLENLKAMIMTLFNSTCLRKQDYPLHASMVCFHFPKRDIGVVLAGEENSGKSEIMDALMHLCDKRQIPYTKIFDDQGTLHYLDNEIVATGTEIGAYIHGDALPRERILTNVFSSVLVKEDTSTHFLTPFTNYEETCRFHKVDILLYLDNYEKAKGIKQIDDLEAAFQIFHSGKYRGHGKKQPSYSPFFNPLGPYQNKELAGSILRQFLSYIFLSSIYVGILFTRCTPSYKEHAYHRFAKQVLTLLQKE